jgi:hypothetical protein
MWEQDQTDLPNESLIGIFSDARADVHPCGRLGFRARDVANENHDIP